MERVITRATPCLGCGTPMQGISMVVIGDEMPYDEGSPVREICESCGGNTTQYSKQNPHPQSKYAGDKNVKSA